MNSFLSLRALPLAILLVGGSFLPAQASPRVRADADTNVTYSSGTSTPEQVSPSGSVADAEAGSAGGGTAETRASAAWGILNGSSRSSSGSYNYDIYTHWSYAYAGFRDDFLFEAPGLAGQGGYAIVRFMVDGSYSISKTGNHHNYWVPGSTNAGVSCAFGVAPATEVGEGRRADGTSYGTPFLGIPQERRLDFTFGQRLDNVEMFVISRVVTYGEWSEYSSRGQAWFSGRWGGIVEVRRTADNSLVGSYTLTTTSSVDLTKPIVDPMDATQVVGNFAERTMTRQLPAKVGETVEVGAFTFNGNAGSMEIAANVSDGTINSSIAKRYTIPIRYHLTGISPANTWLTLVPSHDTGAFNGQNFDLEMKVAVGTATLRLRTTAYTSGAPVATLAIKTTGLKSLTNLTAVGPAVATNRLAGTGVVTEIVGKLGIAADPGPSAALEVNGGNTTGLRLRSRTTAGAPTSGPWSAGTIILDSTGNLYICSAAGTPGVWKKIGQ